MILQIPWALESGKTGVRYIQKLNHQHGVHSHWIENISHQSQFMTDLYISGSPSRRKLEMRRQAASFGTSKIRYPVLGWFPLGSEAGDIEISRGYSGSRLQDKYVLRAYLWFGGDFELLSTLFNESFSKKGIKQNRVLCETVATVWHGDSREQRSISFSLR